MTLLKQETLFNVIDAAIDAGLECDALLLSLPREAQSSLIRLTGRSAREQYLAMFSQLNDWGASERREPPLRTLMDNLRFLVGMRAQAQVFQKALAEIDSAPSGGSEQGQLLFMRTKDFYVERGYRVVPPVDAPVSLTFQAWRGAGAVSVIGVAVTAPVAVVIQEVRTLVEQLAPRERVEGCVVLFSNDARETEQVVGAGLVPVPYNELAPMGVREITALVDRQQAAFAREQPEAGPSSEEKRLFRDVRAALRDRVRVVMVRAPSALESARRIVLRLTSDYLRNPGRAAPLLLPLSAAPGDFRELVATAFNERRVPFSRFDFPGLLGERAFLPVFVADSRQSVTSAEGGAGAARQALASGANVVLVVSEEHAVSPDDLARRWGLRSHNVRTFAAQGSQTKGVGSTVDSPRPVESIVPRAPRFEQGRALLVGVASYARAPRLPESVLSDARDLGTLLQSPSRCGYLETNVEILLDQHATAERMRLGLQRLARDARSDDTVVVFFSGHGLRLSGRDPEAYLLPIDYDPQDLARTALSATELTRLLAAIRSSRLVVLLDACHAAGAAHVKTGDATATFKSGLDEKTYEVLGRGAGRVVMASSRADEPSCVLPGMKNSLFTTYLLEALAGDGANHDDEVVRVLDVFHHISENVPRRAAQHPILKAQDVENNFPIALNLKTKQALTPPRSERKEPPSRSPEVSASPLPPKARLAIKKGLIRRWDDLADYFAIPLADKVKFDRGHEGQRTLEWLEERGRLDRLRSAFLDLGWDDLLAELDRHAP